MQLLVTNRLHFTVKEEITPEWLCIFIVIPLSVEKSHLDRSTDTKACMLKMGKASSASSKSWHCIPLWAVYART